MIQLIYTVIKLINGLLFNRSTTVTSTVFSLFNNDKFNIKLNLIEYQIESY